MMTPATRTRYFALWGKACSVKGWNLKDEARRRQVTLDWMAEIGGPPVTSSDPAFGPDETTALFVWLDHLAHPSDLLKAAAVVDCRTDYQAYNQSKQADWHEGKAYGPQGSGRLKRDRFAGKDHAAGEPLEPLNPDEIKKRLLTMRARNTARTGYRSKRPTRENAIVARPVAPAAQASQAELDEHNCAW